MTVLSSLEEPPIPQLRDARFSDDGISVLLSFDSTTNKGLYLNTFPCAAFLSFLGIETTTCQWRDSSTVTIYGSNATLTVGSVIVATAIGIIMGGIMLLVIVAKTPIFRAIVALIGMFACLGVWGYSLLLSMNRQRKIKSTVQKLLSSSEKVEAEAEVKMFES